MYSGFGRLLFGYPLRLFVSMLLLSEILQPDVSLLVMNKASFSLSPFRLFAPPLLPFGYIWYNGYCYETRRVQGSDGGFQWSRLVCLWN
ncbi:hypothetical protein BDV30DRAFT_208226 [Aspergillus minisclerotigenes]|uniref:Secreted protein n=1 Tax=Aspergillus minisclerotigenes TaxID=656917 RepID=A0A5N6J9W5_9EURO|nr:hypothetical protein BDV30DRAFT_208226 [Aspergillus minisclerotigenes]